MMYTYVYLYSQRVRLQLGRPVDHRVQRMPLLAGRRQRDSSRELRLWYLWLRNNQLCGLPCKGASSHTGFADPPEVMLAGWQVRLWKHHQQTEVKQYGWHFKRIHTSLRGGTKKMTSRGAKFGEASKPVPGLLFFPELQSLVNVPSQRMSGHVRTAALASTFASLAFSSISPIWKFKLRI